MMMFQVGALGLGLPSVPIGDGLAISPPGAIDDGKNVEQRSEHFHGNHSGGSVVTGVAGVSVSA
jgi:hypothetical protein